MFLIDKRYFFCLVVLAVANSRSATAQLMTLTSDSSEMWTDASASFGTPDHRSLAFAGPPFGATLSWDLNSSDTSYYINGGVACQCSSSATLYSLITDSAFSFSGSVSANSCGMWGPGASAYVTRRIDFAVTQQVTYTISGTTSTYFDGPETGTGMGDLSFALFDYNVYPEILFGAANNKSGNGTTGVTSGLLLPGDPCALYITVNASACTGSPDDGTAETATASAEITLTLTPTPEPTSLTFLVSTLPIVAGAAYLRRRRRAKA